MKLHTTMAMAALLLASCEGLKIGDYQITADDIRSAVRVGQAVVKSSEDITPEQQYYLGRTVAAGLLANHPPLPSGELGTYVSQLGECLVLFSEKPELFKGYSFQVLDTEEVNAFATPGGHVLVTKGLLRCCEAEDDLAAVLAHEIAHVQHNHGIKAIKGSRWTQVGTLLAREAAARYTQEELSQLVTAFDGAVEDVMASLVNGGYSRSCETEADASAIAILKRAGYNPRALHRVLEAMKTRCRKDSGFGKTHPDPEDRQEDIRPMISTCPEFDPPLRSKARFQLAVKGL
ncbi:MAG: M48 family metallopeptidase [Planctomycetota bacterium]